MRRTIASSASAGEMTYSPEPTLVSSCRAASRVGEVALGAELLEERERLVEVALGDRPRAGLGDEAAEREVAEGGLIPLAEQIEQRRALREVVVRVGRRAVLRVQRAAQPQVLAPRGRRHARIERVGGRREALLRLGQASGERQGFGGDERRLQRVEGRRAGREDVVGARDRFVERAAAEREPRAEDAHRPFVPLAGLAAVGAVRLAGAGQELAGDLVAAANQVNLRQRVEHRAGRLVELNRAAHVERAVQRVLGAREVAEPHADLSERAERDGQAVAGAVRLVERDAALGQRERLLVAVLEHHHVRLVAADRGQHVVGVDERGQPLGVPQRRHRFFVAPELRERDARQRVDEREVAAVAGGVQRGRGLGDVLADDRDVADLAVALAELVVGEPDGARVVRGLGLLQRAAVHGDRARLVAAGRGQPAVQPPQRRQPARRDGVAEGVGRAAERGRRLVEVVLQQPRLGERGADGELVVARQAARAERRRRAAARLRARGPVRARRPRAPAAPGGWMTPRGEYKEEPARRADLLGPPRPKCRIEVLPTLNGLAETAANPPKLAEPVSDGLGSAYVRETVALSSPASLRACSEQSQSQHAHGSSPVRSRHRLRACASWTFSSVKYSSQYSRSSWSGVGQKQTSTHCTRPSSWRRAARMFRMYSSPATDPRPSVPSAIASCSGDSWPGFSAGRDEVSHVSPSSSASKTRLQRCGIGPAGQVDVQGAPARGVQRLEVADRLRELERAERE